MEPVSREYLRGLRGKKIEENRVKFVDHYVTTVYSLVKQTATNTTQTLIQHQILYQVQDHNGQISVRDNMPDILFKLQNLFPDSKVDFKTLSRGQDGKMYDVADIDERMRPFIDTRNKQDFIVVDWS
jgi:hypothetical protein